MSTVTQPGSGTEPAPPPGDPFIYGWRDVPVTGPDGTTDFVQVPLTLEDVLNPQFGDHIVESTVHDLVCMYLAGVFRARTYHDPTALVFSDVGVYWDDPALKHHSPDVSLIFGVRNRGTPRQSFDVATEGTRPWMLVEVVSPTTRVNDVETKFALYHQAHVPYYIIIDRRKASGPWELHGYQHAPGNYEEMPKDERGRLWLEAIGVWLGTDGQQVICYDGKTDEPIGDYLQITEKLAEMRRNAEAETARAEAEKARADAEIAAREAVEARLREVEAELARMRGQPPAP